ncbi:MAG: hypothetical protein LBM75_02575 [Myxococcales bacterium]|nr:hypothetical protein [Myxococcales bacterium]
MTRADDDVIGADLELQQLEAAGEDENTPVTPTAIELSPDVLGDSPLAADVQEALVRLSAATLLEDLYDARVRLCRARADAADAREQERLRLEKKAGIFLNAVASAKALGERPSSTEVSSIQPSSAGADPYTAFLDTAKLELDGARAALAARAKREMAFFEAAIAQASEAITAHADALLDGHAPVVNLSIQPVGATSATAWIDRPSGDDAVLLYLLLTDGFLPTRYDALFDDAIDDLALAPATFFAEEGFTPRPASLEEAEALSFAEGRRFIPYKAMLPFRLPGRDFPRLRFVNQGPILQLVARVSSASPRYEPLMPLEMAEAVAGLFIRLQVEKRIELRLMAS